MRDEKRDHPFSRRDFLSAALLSLGGIALKPHISSWNGIPGWLPESLPGEQLGRVLGEKVEVKLRPDEDSPTVLELFNDDLVVWLRERVGSRLLWNDQRYVETPQGFIYAPNLQPVRNLPNRPLNVFPEARGIWVEVSVPYVDILLANPPARSPWLNHTTSPRLYYSQVLFADQIRIDDRGQTWYRVGDRYGSFGDYFWAAAEAFRPIAADEIAPINPEVEDKLVMIDLSYQTLACLEGKDEVYFCRVSTGPKINRASKTGGEWATPPGKHTIWRKLVSVHMTGGTTGSGYDLPGVGWTALFSSKGMAIHSTFWHNSYGAPRSHGCVNCSPEDALWVFRWTMPAVALEPGDLIHQGDGSTKVLVTES